MDSSCHETFSSFLFSLATSGVRLVGDSHCSGRVEVSHGNTWVTVCDAVFDQQDPEVVCRELDCGAPVQVLRAAAFGKGDAQMWTQEIQCRGNESQIHLCPTSSQKLSCSHDDHQGLLCDGRSLIHLRVITSVTRIKWAPVQKTLDGPCHPHRLQELTNTHTV